MKLNKDFTFSYKFAYDDELIYGKWKMENDSIFMISDEFIYSEEELEPVRKITDFKEDVDFFLIKNTKLVGSNNQQKVILYKCP